MVAIDASAARFDMGRVMTRTVRVLGRNFVPFCALAFLGSLPELIIPWWRGASAITSAFRHGDFPSLGWLLIEYHGPKFLASMIMDSLVLGAIVYGTIQTLRGNAPRFSECLSRGFDRWPRLVGVGLVQTAIFVAGLVFLIVPGLIAATVLCISISACVAEDKSVLASLARSAELTSGHRWALFGLMIVLILLAVGLGLATRPLSGIRINLTLPIGRIAVYLLANTVVHAVLTAINAVGFATVYYELRTIREGMGQEQLAAVFA